MADQPDAAEPLEITNNAVTDPPITGAHPSAGSGRIRTLIFFMVGIVSGTIVWTVAPGFASQAATLSDDLKAKAPGSMYNQELSNEIKAAEREGAGKGAMVLFGIFGAIVGASLGVVTGMLRRSLAGSCAGLMAGLMIGGGMGILMGRCAVPLEEWFNNSLPYSLTGYRAMLVHAVVWGGIGLGIGMATGFAVLSFQQAARGMASVAIAGMAAAFVYATASAILLPMQNADRLIPTGSFNQWTWLGLTSGMMGLAVATINREGDAHHSSKVLA